MRAAALLAVALVAAAAVARADAVDTVLELDDSTFDDTISGNTQTLVEFFAPWCGHCKALAPEYAEAAKKLAGKEAGVLASVDCTEHKELCSRFEVRGFPTLKLFRADGSHSEFDQARKADAIVSFMVKQSQPAVTQLESAAGIESFAEGESVKVIFFAPEGADTAAYEAVAQQMRNDHSFAVVTDDAAAAEHGVTVPGVLVVRDFDDGNKVFGGEIGDDLVDFVKTVSFPLVGTIGPDTYSKYLDRGFPFVWIFHGEDEAATADLIEVATNVAKEYPQLSFVKLDGVKWASHAENMGVNNVPGCVVEDKQRKKNYVYDGDFSAASFAEFMAGYADGSLAPTVKSEPEPESNDAPVTVLVGSNFERIVLDKSKDVLVEFYAPWCGHCKSLAPKYDDLGEKFAGDSNIVIAKVDATANDVPADVSGFPTLIFYSAEDNEEIEYSGGRTAEAMAEFIEKNRKSSAGEAATGEAAGHDDL